MNLKTVLYKSYVIFLMGVVVWAAQLFYSLIYWEFEYEGVETGLFLSEKESGLSRMNKIRQLVDNANMRTYDLGDTKLKEHYEEKHFHHVGQTLEEPVLNGCDYCHTNTPHQIEKEARAFRNMHGYFLACEACHFPSQFGNDGIEHSWIDTGTKKVISRPAGLVDGRNMEKSRKDIKQVSSYKARIVPWIRKSRDHLSILSHSDLDEAEDLLVSGSDMDQASVKKQLTHMHRGLTKKPHKCNACHSKKNSAIQYLRLGYNKKEARKLMDTEIASVISEYKQFHFPNLFIRKDDRQSHSGAK